MNDASFTASCAGLPPIVSAGRLFKGDQGNPLLAPRGVFITQGKLIVSDTGQNRVFIWDTLPTDLYCPPDVVLGQLDTQHTGRNSGTGVSAQTLQYPSGIWTDGKCLLICDAWNHRVLIWHTFPTVHGQPADCVIGQPSFDQNQPNVAGIGAAPSAESLYWPYGVFSDGKQVWVADTGNRRVLYYQEIPAANFTSADAVIGQSSFTERDYDNQSAIWPYAVRVSPEGKMLISDTQYYRTLVWQDWTTAFSQSADIILGQPDFDGNGLNQYGLSPQQNTLSWTYDACFYQNGIWVADTGNSRILWFDTVPSIHNSPAQNLLGHAHFHTGSENATTRYGTENQLYWPFSLSVVGQTLAVADTGNHRVVLYDIIPDLP